MPQLWKWIWCILSYIKSNCLMKWKALKPASHCPIIWRIRWKIGGKIGQWERTIGRSDAILKNRMDFDISDSIEWIASDYLFLSLRKVHYEINITKIVSDRSGSGNEKSEGIWANMNRIRLCPSTPMPSNSLKSGNGTPALRAQWPFGGGG